MDFSHYSVMLPQCIEGLAIRPDGVYIDGTAGGAGHSRAIAERLTTGRLLSFDRDPDAVAEATRRLAPYPVAEVLHRDFASIPEVLAEKGIAGVDGILLDLGVSSYQLDNPERGFAYSVDAPLDMRMSREGATAADLLNTWDAESLARVFREFGEERFAYPIAKKIVAQREKEPFTHTGQLVDLIYAVIPAAARREGGHPAKRVFQALRIAVNIELDQLSRCLDTAFDCLNGGGRFVILTFHSLEDRMVKQKFAEYCRGCTCPPEFPVCVCGNSPRARLVNRKPIEADEQELAQNSRSRSAKLRILEKL